jgi:SAM-dependent methyltransferase
VPEHRDREYLRTTFGTVAEQYDRARPTYPAAVHDELAKLAGLENGSRVLEIGPGTGKATVELARRGYVVTGVELSPELATVARRNLEDFEQVEIEVGDFEAWEPQEAGYDAIVAFSAFHWIAPALRYTKPARLLGPGGTLAVVGAPHVRLAWDEPVWSELEEIYDAVVPHPDNRPPPLAEEVEGWRAELEASGLFENVTEHHESHALTYTADEYVALLGTFSDNLALPEEQRAELFGRIHERVAAQPGGTVTTNHIVTLTAGQRPR